MANIISRGLQKIIDMVGVSDKRNAHDVSITERQKGLDKTAQNVATKRTKAEAKTTAQAENSTKPKGP